MHSIFRLWGTSSGTFNTTKVGNVIPREHDAKNPMFDVIIGVDTLVTFGVILDVSKKNLTIDHH